MEKTKAIVYDMLPIWFCELSLDSFPNPQSTIRIRNSEPLAPRLVFSYNPPAVFGGGAMDFDYSPQEESFRQELRTWLGTNLPEEYTPETFETLDEDARFKIRLKWQKKLHAAGLVGVHWPDATMIGLDG